MFTIDLASHQFFPQPVSRQIVLTFVINGTYDRFDWMISACHLVVDSSFRDTRTQRSSDPDQYPFRIELLMLINVLSNYVKTFEVVYFLSSFSLERHNLRVIYSVFRESTMYFSLSSLPKE